MSSGAFRAVRVQIVDRVVPFGCSHMVRIML